jgi:hypothetical protein
VACESWEHDPPHTPEATGSSNHSNREKKEDEKEKYDIGTRKAGIIWSHVAQKMNGTWGMTTYMWVL